MLGVEQISHRNLLDVGEVELETNLRSSRRFVSSSIGKTRVVLESCVVVTTSLSILGELMAGRPGNKMEKLR